MKMLVLCAAYPNDVGCKALTFVHVRNLYYLKQGCDVTVVNFAAKTPYEHEGIKVVPLDYFDALADKGAFDLLLCHAPNIRHHRLFLQKYGNLYPVKVFFFHGHEIRHLSSSYGKPYYFKRKSFIKRLGQAAYDVFKIAVWRRYFAHKGCADGLVFVSECLRLEFCRNLRMNYEDVKRRSSVIPNCVGEEFEKETYSRNGDKEYDFITIRSNLDASNYCVDVVNKVAYNNPAYSFLVVGKGEFFSHFKKSANVKWIDRTLSHGEMVSFLQKSRCGLMPTKIDSQGLSMCEMATLGIPLISSNIEVCSEVLACFPNVALFDNDTFSQADIGGCLAELERSYCEGKVRDYCANETVRRELNLFDSLLS